MNLDVYPFLLMNNCKTLSMSSSVPVGHPVKHMKPVSDTALSKIIIYGFMNLKMPLPIIQNILFS